MRDAHGVVPSQRTSPDQTPRPTVRTPDPAELMWLEEARELLRGPGIDLTDVQWLGTQLDTLMASWHTCPPAQRWNRVPTTTALGIAAGDAVIARVPGLQWVCVPDTAGPRFALAHPATTAVAHPIEAVDEIWTTGGAGLLPELVDGIAARALHQITPPVEPALFTGALRLLGLRR